MEQNISNMAARMNDLPQAISNIDGKKLRRRVLLLRLLRKLGVVDSVADINEYKDRIEKLVRHSPELFGDLLIQGFTKNTIADYLMRAFKRHG